MIVEIPRLTGIADTCAFYLDEFPVRAGIIVAVIVEHDGNAFISAQEKLCMLPGDLDGDKRFVGEDFPVFFLF